MTVVVAPMLNREELSQGYFPDWKKQRGCTNSRLVMQRNTATHRGIVQEVLYTWGKTMSTNLMPIITLSLALSRIQSKHR